MSMLKLEGFVENCNVENVIHNAVQVAQHILDSDMELDKDDPMIVHVHSRSK